DEFEWNGISVGSDEYLLGYNVSDLKIETVATTRAKADAERDEIKNLTLLVFKGNTLVKSPVYFSSGDANWHKPANGNNGTITVKKNLVDNGTWYLIANAKSQIEELYKNNVKSEDDFLSCISTNNTSYLIDDQLDGQSDHVMVNHEEITMSDNTQTTTKIINLKRIYARVSIEISKSGIPFRMTAASLSRYVPNGDLRMLPSSIVTTAAVTNDGLNWVTPPIGSVNSNPSFKFAKIGEQLLTATYPYKQPDNPKSDNSDKMLMIVMGYYNNGTSTSPSYSDQPCYYAIELPKLEANKHYQIKINGAPAPGKDNAIDAEKEPGGLSVTFEDNTDDIHSIITDGENVLAVVDTVRLDSDGTPQRLVFKARVSGNDSPTLNIIKKDGGASPEWLNKVFADCIKTNYSNKQLSDDEKENNLFTTEFSYNFQASRNEGSERYTVYTVKLEGTK
ncbi:MAG: hypothetical protein K2J15_06455, partial [Muribaculaceae bacterium]|nr:hypothetical protein [Muribaculaceae bacterium]